MTLAAALVYWVIVALWLAVLATVGVVYLRNPRTFGTTRLLLAVVAIDTVRNVIENLYFGLYFGAQYGLFPGAIVGVLGNPGLLIIPKLINVIAACAVLGLLLLRWLPMALRERARADDDVRQQADALRHEAEERRRLFETSLDLILVTDRHGTFIRASPSCATILGYSPDEMIGHSAVKFVHPDDLEATRNEMRLARAGRDTRNFESRYVHKDGHVVAMAWSGVWSDPEQKHFFFGRDMTEHKAAEEKLKHLAHYDQLTGLPNRASLHGDLAKLLDASAGGDRPATSIAVFDLDGFKDINDTLGHSIGDRLLQHVAQRLGASAKDPARAYRLGGDEFVLVLPDCGDPRVIAHSAESVLDRLKEPFEVSGHRLFIGASAGIAIAPADGENVEDLLSNADLALYDAKAGGGRLCRLFVPVLRAKAQARRKLDAELRRAWSEKEFILYFQPQLRVSDGMVVGAEALLRWRHPQRGILGPGAFIGALAESPVALDVGGWILQSACEYAAAWRAAGLPPIRIGVNLFPAQFRDGTLVDAVEAALSRSGLPAEALELEITENIALDHAEAMLAPLQTLRARGVSLAFDDFGTGYASLSYLARYPLTRIKIDQTFVRKITADWVPEDTAIVRSIVAMAHSLGLKVTAEGVETSAQAAFLLAEGCEEVQGFLYAKPLPLAEFEQFLRLRSSAAEPLRTGHQVDAASA
jgi:diguanylate cyclase (GGDEF)-like protein/PAS domain S-box-containing protein